jgi:CTP:molybdopterin cytidylyltransferase MocA
LILAAGGGRRLGGPKALLRHGNATLVERAVAAARDGGCDPTVVVLGAKADAVQAQVDLSGVTVVVNRGWGSGMGSSLRAGLAALADTEVRAVVVLLVDMPGITGAAIRRVAALPYGAALVCASYGGRRGHPMLLGRDHWPGIVTLAASDVGARPYLLAHKDEIQDIVCDDVAHDGDVDTAQDAERFGVTVPGPGVVSGT